MTAYLVTTGILVAAGLLALLVVSLSPEARLMPIGVRREVARTMLVVHGAGLAGALAFLVVLDLMGA